jgi:hypothetical protein
MEEDESSCVKVVIHARPLLKTDGPEAKSAVDVCPRQKQVSSTGIARLLVYHREHGHHSTPCHAAGHAADLFVST